MWKFIQNIFNSPDPYENFLDRYIIKREGTALIVLSIPEQDMDQEHKDYYTKIKAYKINKSDIQRTMVIIDEKNHVFKNRWCRG